MSASTWEGPQFYVDEVYPPSLLKYLLKHMMTQFAAQGACIALYDESIHQMRIRLHVRTRSAANMVNTGVNGIRPRRTTASLGDDTQSSFPTSLQTGPLPSPAEHLGSLHQYSPSSSQSLPPLTPPEELDEISRQQCELFAVGTTYPSGVDLIGTAWAKNEAFVLRHDEYLNHFHRGSSQSFMTDMIPTSYLVVPIQESTLVDDMRGRTRHPQMLGVIVLYQIIPSVVTAFHPRQRADALHYAERIALYLQNDKLQRAQRRTSEYLQRIQEISTVFPTNVKLSELVETIYSFASRIVNISSMQFTLYDRDTDKIYDVFALKNGTEIDGLAEKPHVSNPDDRPVWWQVTQKEKRSLLFSPTEDTEKAQMYAELLDGLWGNQRHAESFLLLPMKMFNRVIGSLCLTSMRPDAYHTEEIQVLETMVQIVTVSIENAKLYERDRLLLHEGKQREAQLAALNSTLQSISSGLNVTELLNNLVNSVADLLKVELCVFFQTSQDKQQLVARALYTPTSTNTYDDGSGVIDDVPSEKGAHAELVERIRLPFKDTMLEQLTTGTFFYLDQSMIDELAQQCDEGGAIFLRETQIQQMLMIPMSSQNELIGVLAVSTPNETRRFRPKDVGTLLAVCAQAIGAIRNAQLFSQREEAYAELQRLDKLKDEFLVTASHELRTPLSAITGYSTLLKRQSTRISPQQILRYVTKIAGAAHQLNDIMTNMTEASKIGTVDKKLELQMGPVMVKTAAEIAASMLSVNIEQHITLSIAPRLCVKGDPLRVRQVLTNLLDNAAKYSPSEGQIHLTAEPLTYAQVATVLPEAQVDEAESSDLPVVLVRVIDSGEGISLEDQKTVFEKFVRAPRSLTTPVRGSGLGLYICRSYIEAMNGRLWLERSVLNEGSVFSFYLPQEEAPIEAEEQDESQFTTP